MTSSRLYSFGLGPSNIPHGCSGTAGDGLPLTWLMVLLCYACQLLKLQRELYRALKRRYLATYAVSKNAILNTARDQTTKKKITKSRVLGPVFKRTKRVLMA
ncbi:hypothetical protein HPB47_017812 [Ixodes persulcatus]|uniref:Uncharacterized protein n=1 Tax=Ixodes persulcatus TaxID=34615 RepID=A0AC60QMC0_IXOPE|nr:hypothetical protein HPB47_017812 [Ixodes persulcatus]